MALGTMGPARLPISLRPNPGNLRYGLFNVAPPQTLVSEEDGQNIADHAYGGGLTYDPMGCGRARLYTFDCNPPATKTFEPNSAEVEVNPFAVYSSLACGPQGMTPAFMAQKTSERLHSSEQAAVEEAFWTGSAGNTPFLSQASAVDIAPGLTFATITDAVAALEAHAYGVIPYGHHAVLHARSSVHAYAAQARLVNTAAQGFADVWGTRPEEPILRTSLGTKWVFGGGYPGTGIAAAAPGAGKTFIFITGNVTTWRQSEWTPPDPARSAFDRSINEFRLLAERSYLATFDCFSACALVAIPKAAA
jgi:hypothetical protein